MCESKSKSKNRKWEATGKFYAVGRENKQKILVNSKHHLTRAEGTISSFGGEGGGERPRDLWQSKSLALLLGSYII